MRDSGISTRGLTLLLAGALLLGVEGAAAQHWEAEVGAGGAAHEGLASRVTSQSAILGLRYSGTGWLYLSAGAPLESEGIPWAAAGAGRRVSTQADRLWFGADLAAHAHAYRDAALEATGSGLTAELLPFTGTNLGPAWIELYSGVLHHTTSYDGDGESRTLHDSGISLALPASPDLSLHARLRYARAPEADYPFAGASATYTGGFGSAWVHAGQWMSDAIEGPVWGAGVSLAIARRYALRLSVEQETNDPLYWSAPRQSWNVALSRRFGAARADAGAGAPPPPQVESGEVTIRLPLAEAPASAPPQVAGDFSDWKTLPMQISGGEWVARVRLGPGLYRYAFRRADGSWFVPASAPGRIDDGFGGESILLIVR